MPVHTYRPISHTWLKNVNYYSLIWNTFWKIFKLKPMREMKSPCEMSKVLSLNYHIGDEVVFHNLWKSLDIFRNLSIWSCCLKDPGTPRIKILCLWLRKSWEVYVYLLSLMWKTFLGIKVCFLLFPLALMVGWLIPTLYIQLFAQDKLLYMLINKCCTMYDVPLNAEESKFTNLNVSEWNLWSLWCAFNLSSWKATRKKFGLEWDLNSLPCDTGVMLYLLSYQATWIDGQLWVRYIPDGEYIWIYTYCKDHRFHWCLSTVHICSYSYLLIRLISFSLSIS